LVERVLALGARASVSHPHRATAYIQAVHIRMHGTRDSLSDSRGDHASSANRTHHVETSRHSFVLSIHPLSRPLLSPMPPAPRRRSSATICYRSPQRRRRRRRRHRHHHRRFSRAICAATAALPLCGATATATCHRCRRHLPAAAFPSLPLPRSSSPRAPPPRSSSSCCCSSSHAHTSYKFPPLPGVARALRCGFALESSWRLI
jgi:hypothetical protein